jgi:hypothetical protein
LLIQQQVVLLKLSTNALAERSHGGDNAQTASSSYRPYGGLRDGDGVTITLAPAYADDSGNEHGY